MTTTLTVFERRVGLLMSVMLSLTGLTMATA